MKLNVSIAAMSCIFLVSCQKDYSCFCTDKTTNTETRMSEIKGPSILSKKEKTKIVDECTTLPIRWGNPNFENCHLK